MTFEEFDYVDIDYDANTFTIIKEGHAYTYDINAEISLYNQIIGSGGVDKYEVYSQEDEYYVEDSNREINEEITELWRQLQEME